MIKIKDMEIKSELSEFTLGEFEDITHFFQDTSKDTIETYLDILTYLGVTDEILNEITFDEFLVIIKKITQEKNISKKLIKEITVNDIKYIAYTDKFTLKIKDLSLIESSIKKDSKFFVKTIAILFKDPKITDHYNEEYLKIKTEVFKDIKVKDVYPYIIMISEKLNKKIKLLNDSSTT